MKELAPPRPELIALLDAIKDNPDEDTPRLVLADWLDEQDDPLDAERAAFIRSQIAKHRARRSVKPLTPKIEFVRQWFGPLAGLVGKRVQFARGLPSVKISGERFLKPDVPALLATEVFAFVQFVSVTDTGGFRMLRVAAVPEFRHVAGLGVYPFAPFRAPEAEKFFNSPNLSGLRQIEFNATTPGIAGAQALANNPALSRLRKLTIIYSQLADAAAVALAGSPHLTNLQYLCLAHNNVGDGAAEAIANSPHLANLRELVLSDNRRISVKGKRLLRDKFGARVRLS
jgi:uncharacterized protein (TIGR02996 family)